MAKVYVVTKAEYLEPEIYVAVRATHKAAEAVIKAEFPNARKDSLPGLNSYLCKKNDHESLMFIREEEI